MHLLSIYQIEPIVVSMSLDEMVVKYDEGLDKLSNK